jgi:drug/metabolite transporter (DMT)-like permease
MQFLNHLSHSQAVGLMLANALMWSIAGAVTRQLEAAKGFEVTFWRSAFTLLSLLIILPLWQGRSVFARMHWTSGAFWVSGVCWSIMFTAFMMALTITSVGNVLVTMALGPLMTALLARLWIGQPLPTRTWVAIGAACVGMAYMFGQQLDVNAQGVALGMGVALCVPMAGALNWTVTQRAQARGDQLDLVPCVLIGAAISCLVTLPMAFPFAASGKDLAWLGLLGVVQLALPCTLAVVCARVLKAPEMSLLALMEVIFGIALAWMFAGEVPSQAVIVGGVLVVGALALNEMLGASQQTTRQAS